MERLLSWGLPLAPRPSAVVEAVPLLIQAKGHVSKP